MMINGQTHRITEDKIQISSNKHLNGEVHEVIKQKVLTKLFIDGIETRLRAIQE